MRTLHPCSSRVKQIDSTREKQIYELTERMCTTEDKAVLMEGVHKVLDVCKAIISCSVEQCNKIISQVEEVLLTGMQQLGVRASELRLRV